MSLSICAECLSRLRIPNHTPVTTTLAAAAAATTFVQRSSFHSSSAQYASPLMKKKGPVLAKPSRQSQSAKLKKGSRERPKLPPVGERRAQRRRIVLSNTNALEVPDLQYWSTENMADPETAGKIMALDGPLLDQLRDSKAFKTTQNWSMFRRPATLVRSETIQVGQDMESVNEHAKTLRHLVTGEKASGKSIFALQTMCMAYMNKWIVLNVPEGRKQRSTSWQHVY
jgi:small subunit ribosomal protein S29